MPNKIITNFSRNRDFETQPDFAEKVGKATLGLLHIGFGKTVKVERVSKDNIIFTKKTYSTAQKVTAIVFLILLLPVMGLLAGIGCIAIACSNSHKEILNLYCQSKKPLNKVNSNPQPSENKPAHQPKQNKIPSTTVSSANEVKDFQYDPTLLKTQYLNRNKDNLLKCKELKIVTWDISKDREKMQDILGQWWQTAEDACNDRALERKKR